MRNRVKRAIAVTALTLASAGGVAIATETPAYALGCGYNVVNGRGYEYNCYTKWQCVTVVYYNGQYQQWGLSAGHTVDVGFDRDVNWTAMTDNCIKF